MEREMKLLEQAKGLLENTSFLELKSVVDYGIVALAVVGVGFLGYHTYKYFYPWVKPIPKPPTLEELNARLASLRPVSTENQAQTTLEATTQVIENLPNPQDITFPIPIQNYPEVEYIKYEWLDKFETLKSCSQFKFYDDRINNLVNHFRLDIERAYSQCDNTPIITDPLLVKIFNIDISDFLNFCNMHEEYQELAIELLKIISYL